MVACKLYCLKVGSRYCLNGRLINNRPHRSLSFLARSTIIDYDLNHELCLRNISFEFSFSTITLESSYAKKTEWYCVPTNTFQQLC